MQRIFFAGSWRIWLGCGEVQAKGHLAGSLKVGNDRECPVDVAARLLPFIGCPARSVVTSPINSSTGGRWTRHPHFFLRRAARLGREFDVSRQKVGHRTWDSGAFFVSLFSHFSLREFPNRVSVVQDTGTSDFSFCCCVYYKPRNVSVQERSGLRKRFISSLFKEGISFRTPSLSILVSSKKGQKCSKSLRDAIKTQRYRPAFVSSRNATAIKAIRIVERIGFRLVVEQNTSCAKPKAVSFAED
jgi:hypothetical protein